MSPSQRIRWDATGSGAALGALLCWSTVPLFLRSFIHEIDAWTANGVRYPIAALFWLGPLLYFSRQGRVDGIYFRRALVPTVFNLAAQSLWAWSPYFLEPALMAFLAKVSGVFAVLCSFLVFRDESKLLGSGVFWTGLLFCFLGFLGMTFLGPEIPRGTTLVGIIIILFCGVFFSWYGIAVRWAMTGVDSRIAFAIISIYTSVGTVVLMALFGEPSRLFDMTQDRHVLLVVSALVGIAFAHVFFYIAIARIGVAITTGCQLLSPFLTAVGSFFIFHEVLTFGQWTSGAVLLAGCALLMWSQEKVHSYHAARKQ
ncbi:MAG TPA: DMT family transporter [bacterium]|nr:DMT family transporter [bacterium]HQO33070.1 DMT family transporter [bacterium]HQP98039.1 DMT family transporter [bacterium]